MSGRMNWTRYVPYRDYRHTCSDNDVPRIAARIVARDYHLKGQVDLSAACICPDRRTDHRGPCPSRHARPA